MLEQLLPQFVGPAGGLVLAVVALTVLWRQSRIDLKAKDKLFAELLLSKNEDLAFERARTALAEERLERIGGLLKDATTLMDKSLDLTEKALERLEREDGRAR